jgi:phosphatidyl-myo-inositol alpha-mannosyltransferase
VKIALVCPYDWCVEGGVRTHVRQLAHHFREWGHDVTIFAPASDPDAAKDDITVMGYPRRVRASGSVARITFTWQSRQVKDALAAGNFHIVHIHEPLMPLLPYHFLKHSSAVNIGTFHAAREGGSRIYGYTRPLTKRWFRKLDGKIAVSAAAAGLVSRYFAGYYNIIPNGIDYEYWSERREPLPEFQDGKRNILFVGRPEKRKGLKYLLRAYMMLREQRDDVRLIVVGAGDFGRYERLMRDYDDVVFEANVPYDRLPRFHYSADVMCCPNTGGESQGYVLMEALATGLPVVASNIEGFAGVVTDGLDAVLVPPREPKAIADAIGGLLDDPGRARELGCRGQRRAEDYSWDKVARRVYSYYERVLQAHELSARRTSEPVTDSVAR